MADAYFKTIREAAGLTQQQVADAVGVRVQSVSAWDRAMTTPDIALSDRLAKVYGVPVEKLIREIIRRRMARRRVPA